MPRTKPSRIAFYEARAKSTEDAIALANAEFELAKKEQELKQDAKLYTELVELAKQFIAKEKMRLSNVD
jgi:hypothetical protein